LSARLAAAVATLVAAALLTGCSTGPQPGPQPVGELVRVEQGELLGRVDGTGNGAVLRYRGVPFAAAPVGDLRFAAPRPPAPWTGVRPATAPGPRCAQPAAAADIPHATAASTTEDCLTLDVTVPAGTTPASRLPVLVWVHGGGFSAGAAGDYDPRRLATAGPLVVVTVNYRLGVLGFLGLPGLADSGSFGLLDQQQALRWVQRNAATFGGDPGRVTLAGESAGADSVCSQLASPGAAGLFQRAVLQSGGCGAANLTDVIRPGAGPGGDTWKPLPLVEDTGAALAGRLGCADPQTAPACLRALPVDRLLGAGGYWSPAVDTPTLPTRPSALVATGGLAPVPVLAGTTRDEGTLFTDQFYDRADGPLTADRFAAQLETAAGGRARAATAAYPLAGRAPGRVWADVVTDRAYACTGLATYRGLGARAPLFAYEFADPGAPATFDAPPADLADGVTHGAEVAYLFDLVPGQPAFTPAQQGLADRMVAAWARFAATGDPGDGTAWPSWRDDGTVRTLSSDPAAGRLSGTEFAAEHRCAVWTTAA
jgi:para-nitrobenzyl esterase